jgi:glutamate dehydrogenase/leucine dehydrogenase
MASQPLIDAAEEPGDFVSLLQGKYGKTDGFTNYVRGANIAGFVKVADAMLAQGIV